MTMYDYFDNNNQSDAGVSIGEGRSIFKHYKTNEQGECVEISQEEHEARIKEYEDGSYLTIGLPTSAEIQRDYLNGYGYHNPYYNPNPATGYYNNNYNVNGFMNTPMTHTGYYQQPKPMQQQEEPIDTAYLTDPSLLNDENSILSPSGFRIPKPATVLARERQQRRQQQQQQQQPSSQYVYRPNNITVNKGTLAVDGEGNVIGEVGPGYLNKGQSEEDYGFMKKALSNPSNDGTIASVEIDENGQIKAITPKIPTNDYAANIAAYSTPHASFNGPMWNNYGYNNPYIQQQYYQYQQQAAPQQQVVYRTDMDPYFNPYSISDDDIKEFQEFVDSKLDELYEEQSKIGIDNNTSYGYGVYGNSYGANYYNSMRITSRINSEIQQKGHEILERCKKRKLDLMKNISKGVHKARGDGITPEQIDEYYDNPIPINEYYNYTNGGILDETVAAATAQNIQYLSTFTVDLNKPPEIPFWCTEAYQRAAREHDAFLGLEDKDNASLDEYLNNAGSVMLGYLNKEEELERKRQRGNNMSYIPIVVSRAYRFRNGQQTDSSYDTADLYDPFNMPQTPIFQSVLPHSSTLADDEEVVLLEDDEEINPDLTGALRQLGGITPGPNGIIGFNAPPDIAAQIMGINNKETDYEKRKQEFFNQIDPNINKDEKKKNENEEKKKEEEKGDQEKNGI